MDPKFEIKYKFIETLEKIQNKFCWTPLEPLFTMNLTKLTFRQ
jgi:hypothetical protein